jgi:hypothetical protein
LQNLPSIATNGKSIRITRKLGFLTERGDAMPYMKDGKRDYKRQNELYNSRPEERARRVKLTQIQRELEKQGKAKVGDGKDNAHKVARSKGGSDSLKNIKQEAASKNRSFARNSDSTMKHEKSRKGK